MLLHLPDLALIGCSLWFPGQSYEPLVEFWRELCIMTRVPKCEVRSKLTRHYMYSPFTPLPLPFDLVGGFLIFWSTAGFI